MKNQNLKSNSSLRFSSFVLLLVVTVPYQIRFLFVCLLLIYVQHLCLITASVPWLSFGRKLLYTSWESSSQKRASPFLCGLEQIKILQILHVPCDGWLCLSVECRKHQRNVNFLILESNVTMSMFSDVKFVSHCHSIWTFS